MPAKPTNLRFLLALGNTKIIALQNEDDLRIYSSPLAKSARNRTAIVPEHVAEALSSK